MESGRQRIWNDAEAQRDAGARKLAAVSAVAEAYENAGPREDGDATLLRVALRIREALETP